MVAKRLSWMWDTNTVLFCGSMSHIDFIYHQRAAFSATAFVTRSLITQFHRLLYVVLVNFNKCGLVRDKTSSSAVYINAHIKAPFRLTCIRNFFDGLVDLCNLNCNAFEIHCRRESKAFYTRIS